MQLSRLGNDADDLLEAFIQAFAENDPDFSLPGNRYVGAGEIPWDKPGLYVYMAGGTTGQPGAPNAQNVVSTSAFTFAIGYYVMILREVATFGYWTDGGMNNASDDVLNGNGVQALNDAGALLRAAVTVKNNQKDNPNLVRRGQPGFSIGQCLPVGPMGGMAAMRLLIELSVENQ